MADNKELVQPEKPVTDVYDQKHGRYQDRQGQNTSPGAKPHNPHNPFKSTGE